METRTPSTSRLIIAQTTSRLNGDGGSGDGIIHEFSLSTAYARIYAALGERYGDAITRTRCQTEQIF